MIHILHGDDTFSIHGALQEIQRDVADPALQDANIFRMDAAEFDLPRFSAAAQAMPFMAERRLAVVRGLLATAEERRGGKKQSQGPEQSLARQLTDVLNGLPPTTDVVFVEGRLTPRNSLLRAIAPLAQVREFPTLRGDALPRWVRQRASEKGGTITGPALAMLVEQVGSNLWAMDAELEKLTTYCQDRAIDVADVNALVPSSREPTIFAAVDAIIERRIPTATELTSRLLRSGATVSYVLSMIARQARLVVLAQELASQKVPREQWGERLGIQQEFVLRKTTEQARRYSAEQIRQLYHLLLEMDLSLKTGDLSDELAMAEFLAKAGGLGRTAAASGVR
jgi:DNA polymerase-3 subunit delta